MQVHYFAKHFYYNIIYRNKILSVLTPFISRRVDRFLDNMVQLYT